MSGKKGLGDKEIVQWPEREGQASAGPSSLHAVACAPACPSPQVLLAIDLTVELNTKRSDDGRCSGEDLGTSPQAGRRPLHGEIRKSRG